MSKISLLVVGALLVTGSAFAETTDTTLAPPGCYLGSGCDQNGWATSTSADTELGLTAIIAYAGAPGDNNLGPTNPGSINGDTYTIPGGSDAAYGHPTYALWDFSWSINTGLNGNAQTLSDFTYNLTITDVTSGLTTFYNPLAVGNDDNHSVSDPSQTAQNSENPNFAFLKVPLNFNENLGDDYTITLTENNAQTGALVNMDSINVDVVTPEPSTISLAGLALLGLWFVNRRRMQRS